MSYSFQRKESVPDGARRIVREQCEKAAAALSGENSDINDGVHNARKSFKKIRSLLRMLREPLGKRRYRRENRWFRDAKNRLSSVRDAEAMIETFDALAERFPSVGEGSPIPPLRDALVKRRRRIAEEVSDIEEIARAVAEGVREAAAGSADWKLSNSGFAAVGPGLERLYAKGQKAMEKAFDQPSDERFHAWRKRVKDHWYHMRLLRKVWHKVTAARIDELSRLSDLLGDDHDLGVLIDTLEREGSDLEGDTQTLACLAQRRQGELRSEARLLGARLYAREPDCLAGELRDYWRIWRS